MPRNRYTRSIHNQETIEHAQREKRLRALQQELRSTQSAIEESTPESSPNDITKDRRRTRREQKRRHRPPRSTE